MTNHEDFNVDEAQVGRVLHFVVDNGHGLRCRPALVVEDWPEQGKPGYVNLIVFPDGSNDGDYGKDKHDHPYTYQSGEIILGGPSNSVRTRTGPVDSPARTIWETSVNPNHAVRAFRTWHWPRECKTMENPASPFQSNDIGRIHHNHAAGFVDPHNCIACHSQDKSNLPDKALESR